MFKNLGEHLLEKKKPPVNFRCWKGKAACVFQKAKVDLNVGDSQTGSRTANEINLDK